MTEHQTLRFEDWYRYDVMNDRQVVRLVGITGIGTYHAEFEVKVGADLRRKRQQFKDYVLECMANGVGPHEIEMEEQTA